MQRSRPGRGLACAVVFLSCHNFLVHFHKHRYESMSKTNAVGPAETAYSPVFSESARHRGSIRRTRTGAYHYPGSVAAYCCNHWELPYSGGLSSRGYCLGSSGTGRQPGPFDSYSTNSSVEAEKSRLIVALYKSLSITHLLGLHRYYKNYRGKLHYFG